MMKAILQQLLQMPDSLVMQIISIKNQVSILIVKEPNYFNNPKVSLLPPFFQFSLRYLGSYYMIKFDWILMILAYHLMILELLTE